jgi:hypothetical protein
MGTFTIPINYTLTHTHQGKHGVFVHPETSNAVLKPPEPTLHQPT